MLIMLWKECQRILLKPHYNYMFHINPNDSKPQLLEQIKRESNLDPMTRVYLTLIMRRIIVLEQQIKELQCKKENVSTVNEGR